MAIDLVLDDFLGLNNVLPPEMLTLKVAFAKKQQYLAEAKNVDITNSFEARRRAGYSAIYRASVHSLWSGSGMCLFRDGQTLKMLRDDLSAADVLRSGIIGNRPMTYLALNDLVYYSDGTYSGIIEGGVDRSWGLAVPPMAGLSSTWGTLLAGHYRVAVSYLRADGQESGTSEPAMIEIADNSGIAIAITASSDPTVTAILIYVTRCDGETFYQAYRQANAVQTVSHITEQAMSTTFSKTLLFGPPPAGTMLEYYNGHIYIVDQSTIWHTEPFRYELIDALQDYLSFDRDVTLMGAVEDGMFFGTDTEIAFAQGPGPRKFSMERKTSYGAVKGTMQVIDHLEKDGTLKKWIAFVSKEGLCFGKPGGEIDNVTRNNYIMPPACSGAGLIRTSDGVQQSIAVLKGNNAQETPGYTGRGRLPALYCAGALA